MDWVDWKWIVVAACALAGCSDDGVPLNGGAESTSGGVSGSGTGNRDTMTTAPTMTGATMSGTATASTTAPDTTVGDVSSSSTSSSTSDGYSSSSSSSGSSSSSSTSSGIAFIQPPLDLAANECDVWAQDCPMGDKCTPWANDGGSSWNAWRCVTIASMPGQVGDGCTVVGSAVSGEDDCDLGAMCFYVDQDTNMGECVELCSGSPAAPICTTAGASCIMSNGGILNLCRPPCHPLVGDCGINQVCVPIGDQFVCSLDASGADGVPGDSCSFINDCDAGAACVDESNVPGCFASSCCSSYCTLGDDTPCAAGQVCNAFYPAGTAPMGYEDVGVCGVL